MNKSNDSFTFNKDTLESLEAVFKVTKGLGLSQVCEITGLQPTTIQNWIKRGWVPSPKDKKYNLIQVSRILIINLLRACLKLEQIAQLMAFVNGDVEDLSDDIIPENQLYAYLCDLILRIEEEKNYSKNIILKIVDEEICSYNGPCEDSKDKLKKALVIMLLAYASTMLKDDAEKEFNSII